MKSVRVKTIGIVVLAMAASLGLQATARAQEAGSQEDAAAQGRRPITFTDLISMARLGDPQISPDGKWVAFTRVKPNLAANNAQRDVWLISTSGGEPREFTKGERDSEPSWAPDGKSFAFISGRKGTPQVYLISMDGGEARPLTHLSTGADNPVFSPDGKWILFTSRVYPDCKDDACNKERDEEAAKNPVKAHVYEKLLYRHWTDWWDGKRSHLFVVPVSEEKGEHGHMSMPRDLTPGADYDVPPFNLGAPPAIAFSPDSKEICFTANTDKHEALSTNGDLFVVPVDGSSAPKRITANRGDDWGPAYSPNGRYIAYRSQATPGYESDHWRLMTYNIRTGKHTVIAEKFDRNPESYAWAPNSRTIYFNAENEAEMPLYAVEARTNAKPHIVLKDGFNEEFSLSADGRTIAFTRTSLTAPAEIFATDADGSHVRQLTEMNEPILSRLDLPAAKPFWFDGAGGTKVEGLLLKPPHFDASRRYPMLLLVHGGPQGAWDDAWGYRWNQQVMAAPGYVVVMINPRGSTGYGQQFTAEISGDWGGKVYQDLMNGVDYATSHYPFIDSSRLAAAGGSYGGFMIDWMASQTKGRFKCLISHAGPYDSISMYGATEELWFPEWEYKGTPWTNPALYDKWNPSKYAADFGKYKTPTLIIDGELDFRVPYTQDLEFFTALQRQGVPSKLIIFPDEGHWVLKPQNSQFWYKEFLAWLTQWL